MAARHRRSRAHAPSLRRHARRGARPGPAACLLALCLAVWAATAATAGPAAAAEPAGAAPALVLAREAPHGLDPRGWLVSEKYDGVRAWWDGRQLRTRRGHVIAAPPAWLARLPAGTALDGELWLGRARFDELSALVRREQPDEAAWARVSYLVFELPGAAGDFAERARQLAALVQAQGFDGLRAVAQERLADAAALQRRLAEVVALGGEGLVLHRADAPYVSGRSEWLLKLKPVQDAEAVVLGHTAGKGRHAGRVGALRVRNEAGQVFLLGSGLSDAQRADPPPVGSWVTYRWRGETATGLPRFATFLRVRDEP